MEAALCEMVIQGVETNIEDQLRLVRSKAFFKGEYDTLALQNILEEGRGYGILWNARADGCSPA